VNAIFVEFAMYQKKRHLISEYLVFTVVECLRQADLHVVVKEWVQNSYRQQDALLTLKPQRVLGRVVNKVTLTSTSDVVSTKANSESPTLRRQQALERAVSIATTFMFKQDAGTLREESAESAHFSEIEKIAYLDSLRSRCLTTKPSTTWMPDVPEASSYIASCKNIDNPEVEKEPVTLECAEVIRAVGILRSPLGVVPPFGV